jgi:hypothetical protein
MVLPVEAYDEIAAVIEAEAERLQRDNQQQQDEQAS